MSNPFHSISYKSGVPVAGGMVHGGIQPGHLPQPPGQDPSQPRQVPLLAGAAALAQSFLEQRPQEVSLEYIRHLTRDFTQLLRADMEHLFVADSHVGGVQRRFAIKRVATGEGRELEWLLMLDHENVAPIRLYHQGDPQNHPWIYMVTDLATGGTLSHALGDNARASLLTWDVRLRVAFGIVSGLRGIQRRQLVHHDVKADNIGLGGNDGVTPVLIDFGLAKKMAAQPGREYATTTRSGTGTRGYTCPEYMFGDCEYSEQQEVYSLGVVLLELFTGLVAAAQKNRFLACPDHERNREDQQHRRRMRESDNRLPQAPQRVNELRRLALRCVSNRPEDRPKLEDVETVLRQLQPADAQEPSHSAPCSVCQESSAVGVRCTTGTHWVCGNCVSAHAGTKVEGGTPLEEMPCCDPACRGRFAMAELLPLLPPTAVQHALANAAQQAADGARTTAVALAEEQMNHLRAALRNMESRVARDAEERRGQLQLEADIQRYVAEYQTRVTLVGCPSCGQSIERNAACSHMPCPRGCGTWCYVCLLNLNECQDPDGHYRNDAPAQVRAGHRRTMQRRLDALFRSVPAQLVDALRRRLALDVHQIGLRLP